MSLKKLNAKNFLHPLTFLPGSPQIYKQIKKKSQKLFAFLLIDLDYFKAYNDKYGFVKGDKVIQKTAQIIKTYINQNDFIGHIGGDDFVIITTPCKAEIIAKSICTNFDQQILKFYNKKDRTQKMITTSDRQNNIAKFPIMSVSIAIVTNEYKKLTNVGQISQIAAELKTYAKTKPNGQKSNFVKERRKL